MPVADTNPHPTTQRDIGYRASCYNRSPFKPGYWVLVVDTDNNGHPYHTRQWITHRMSTWCRQIEELPECLGCMAKKDQSYIDQMKEMK